MTRLLSRLAPLLLALALSLGCSDGQATASESNELGAGSTPSIPLAGRVTDAARILNAEQELSLTARLEEVERATKHQMVVVTVPTLKGQDVAVFTRNLANDWGIGRKSHDDGVVLLVAPNERKARIAVGVGLEQTLPDELCSQIMERHILPRFRENNLAAGIEAGVNALAVELAT